MSSHETPLFSQVMSPNDYAADYEAWGQSAWALGAVQDEGGRSDKRARGALYNEDGPASSADVPGPASAAAAPGVALPTKSHAKVKIGLRPLDTGRPEEYEAWRYSVSAELVGSGPHTDLVLRYIQAISDRVGFGDAKLSAEIARDPEMRTLDAKLFAAILSCLAGQRRNAVEERIRATVPFAAGALALRCLDGWFQQGAERRRHEATRELMNLQPAGQTPAALERFFTRFRLLTHQAGGGIGEYARIEILQRAARHPRLAMVHAAWRQAGGVDADDLLTKLEEAVAEAMHAADTKGNGAAWAVLGMGEPTWMEHDEMTAEIRGAEVRAAAAMGAPRSGNAPRPPTPAQGAAVVSGQRCFGCGQRGHIRRECPHSRPGAGARGAERGQHDELMAKLNELTTALRGLQVAASAPKSKNE